MKKRKMIMFISIMFMAIGFASVSAVLYLNGQIGIVGHAEDFDVYFSKAIENGVENSSIIKDRNHLEFTTELRVVDEEYVLDYEVTNASKQYDASIVMNCTGGNDFLRVSNEFDIEEILPARTTRKGTLTLRVIKTPIEEMSVEITCEITGNALEREEVGSEEIKNEGEFEKDTENFLKKAETYPAYNSTFLGHTLDRSKVETITLLNKKEVPENAIDSWDVSDAGNESIMAYLLDEDSNGLYELYIGQNGGVQLNPDSSYLFFQFYNITQINGVEKLDTSKVTNMESMFTSCRTLKSLDVTNFDTHNVTNISGLFNKCSSLMEIDVSGFNTSNVIEMSGVFVDCKNLTHIDISNFDTSKVTIINSMFRGCSNITNLDLSNFDTSNVENMGLIFMDCTNLTEVNLSNFITSKVTHMDGMFSGCSSLTELDLSAFDMNKVTTTIGMFRGCSNLATVNRNFSGNITQMDSMFSGCSKLTTNVYVTSTSCTGYSYMFSDAATEPGASIVVYYAATTSIKNLAMNMFKTKSTNSKVYAIQS